MSQQHVLVIDDEKNMRHMLKTLLGKAGYVVESAADGAGALELMMKSNFRFILCDIKTPHMDGMTFLK
ncbi:MAG: response regulator, partial [Deltaproteobacteria bacterium]|nr:response regulator [Deltaproteobacteria bacterium]